MPVTLQDIAERLNLSSSTVSRSLRHDRLIHPATRANVISTAMAMGYKSRSRRNARTADRDQPITVLISNETVQAARSEANRIRLIEGMSTEADSRALALNLSAVKAQSRGLLTAETLPSLIREHRSQAVVLVGKHERPDIELISTYCPVVSITWRYDFGNVSSVLADNVDSVCALTGRLIEQGHTRLAWLTDYYEAPFFIARQSGFTQAILTHGLRVDQQRFLLDRATLFHGNDGVLRPELIIATIKAGITGFVCASDRVAYELVTMLEALGHSVPGTVSVTGFDAVPAPPGCPVIVDSIDPDFVEIGRLAIRLVAQIVDQPLSGPVRIFTPATIAAGNSIGPARSEDITVL